MFWIVLVVRRNKLVRLICGFIELIKYAMTTKLLSSQFALIDSWMPNLTGDVAKFSPSSNHQQDGLGLLKEIIALLMTCDLP